MRQVNYLDEIRALRVQIDNLENLLTQRERTVKNSLVGDTLDDGSIIIKKDAGMAILMSPRSTEFVDTWETKTNGSDIKYKFQLAGLKINGWFLPSVDILQLAWDKCGKTEFSPGFFYWSSTEVTEQSAASLRGGVGDQYTRDKKHFCIYRLFKCVLYDND